MTAQGSPLTRYGRAIDARSILMAREMSWVPLTEALRLLALYAELEDPKYEKAAVRWLVRLAVERPDLRLTDLQFALAALDALTARPETDRESAPRPHGRLARSGGFSGASALVGH